MNGYSAYLHPYIYVDKKQIKFNTLYKFRWLITTGGGGGGGSDPYRTLSGITPHQITSVYI